MESDDYKTVSVDEGIHHLSNIRGIVFSHEKDLFIKSGINESLCRRSMIVRTCVPPDNGKGDSIQVYCYGTSAEDVLIPERRTGDSLYLYGTYGQVTVAQLRVQGTLRLVTDSSEFAFNKAKLNAVLTEKREVSSRPFDKFVWEKALKLLRQEGRLYRFDVCSFAISYYSRG